MRILDQSQHTEEKLHQSTLSCQGNPVKELKLSQVVQVALEAKKLLLRYKEMLKVRRKQFQLQELHLQKKLLSYNH